MKVKPAEGLKVRDPITKQFIGNDHEVDPSDLYWNRRLRDGDVVEADAAQADEPGVKGAKA